MTDSTSLPDSRELQTLVQHATLAPSSHNTQPWRFEVREGRIDLVADHTRALPVNDPHDRELTISCGAALFNLRVAAAQRGLHAAVELLPGGAASAHLATIALTRGEPADPALARLFGAIAARRTYREAFDERALDPGELAALAEAAEREGAWLHVLEGAARRDAAALVARGDAAQWADPRWRRELAAWMRSPRRGDGITLPALAAPFTRAFVRRLDLGKRVGVRDAGLAERAPALAVLGTAGDGPDAWLRAGQALERALLEGCERGVQASYQNQPVQVAALRSELATLTGKEGSPQLLICFGRPRRTLPASPRRPVSDVVSPA